MLRSKLGSAKARRRRGRVLRFVLPCSLAALLWARVAPAQTPAPAHARAKLEYVAPAELGCPDREAFAASIATRVGYEAIVDSEGADDAKNLNVQFRAESKAIRATLRLSNTAQELEAEKTVVSETGACTELAAAAAFAAAILLDPRAMFPRFSKPVVPGPNLDSHAAGTSPWYEPPEREAPPPPPPAPWRWRAGLGAGPCVGCAPSVNAGALLFAGVAKGRLGLDFGVRADLPSSADAPSGRSVSSSLVLGELFPHARLGPVHLGIVGSLGPLFGDSQGETQASLFASVGPRVAFEWTVAGPVFLRLALDGAVVLSRVRLRVEGFEVWCTPALVAGANLGGGVEF